MNDRETKFVSVVIPTYNRAATLPRAIKSVLSQDYSNLELIIVDDASTDETRDVVSSFVDERITLIVHEKNKGVSAARNTGIKAASGEIIAFQDSDDEWLYGKLKKQLVKLEEAGEKCVLVYCTKIVYGRDERRRRGKRHVACVPTPDEIELRGDMRNVMERTTSISPQTMLIRREALLSIGSFDERLYGSEEWDLAFRLARQGMFEFVDEPLVNTYLQTDSISNVNTKVAYSLLIIYNKMKRAGVANTVQAQRWAQLGTRLARMGHPARGHKFLLAALTTKPWSFSIWMHCLANVVLWQRRLHGSLRRRKRSGLRKA